jgi:putative endonuclease
VTGGASGRPRDTGAASSDRHGTPGSAAEAEAARWYEDQGYEILERHWHRREGEIDLIARRATTVAFCDVTSRSSDRVGTEAESVLPATQRRFRRLASRWLSELTPAVGRARVEVRFDVAYCTASEVEVVEDAF